MNEHRLDPRDQPVSLHETERLLADWFESEAPPYAPPVLLPAVLARTALTRRRSAWRIPERWLPAGRAWRPSTSRSTTQMFTATRLVAASAILALVSGFVVNTAMSGPSPHVPVTLVVAQDGSGDFATVGEAVAAAVDGDTIVVKPGEYAEAVFIERDITLRGDGPREGVVLAYPEGTPPDPRMEDKLTLYLMDADATVQGLTIRAPIEAGAVMVDGGAPLFEDVSVEMTPGSAGTFWFGGGTTATVRDSSWDGFWIVVESSPTIEGNTASGGARLFGPSEAVIRGNTFLAGDINVHEFSGLLERNDFTGAGVTVASGTLEGTGPDDSDVVIRDNTFRDVTWVGEEGQAAIRVGDPGSTAEVAGNTITGSDTGILAGLGTTATVTGNTVTGNVIGISVGSSDVVLEDNAITGNETGLTLLNPKAQPTLTGNIFCDNGIDLEALGDEPNPTTLDGNEVCAPGASAAP